MNAVGISSDAVALNMQPDNIVTATLFNAQPMNYWNLWDYRQALYSFVDGGKLLHVIAPAAGAFSCFLWINNFCTSVLVQPTCSAHHAIECQCN